MFYDTHPATADRIKSLGVQVPERDSEIRAFIERYNIGESSSILRQALGFDTRRTEMFLDGIWGFVNDLLWKIRNVEGEGLRTALERIEKEENYRKEGLGTEKMWRKASLVAELNGLDEALPIVKSILEISPNHAGANYLMGQLMVEKFDPTGIVYIETAIENDPLSYQLEGLLALSDIYRRLGNIRESEETFTRIFSVGEAYDKAVTERDKPIRFFNQFAPHSLTEDQIEDFCYTFAGVSSIKKVYAVRKMVDHIPETPYHVLIVVPTLKGAIDLANTIKAVEKTFAFSGSLAFVVAGPLRKPLLWKASTKPNSLIYDQNSSDRFKYTMD
ncbi:MAG: hypothetical protein P1V20_20770 [Verrucomicrobiales bacterium]|nr:hypothetical protein [Verrucomicrobiales bacterium]